MPITKRNFKKEDISIFPTLDSLKEAEELILSQAKNQAFNLNQWKSLIEVFKNTYKKHLNQK